MRTSFRYLASIVASVLVFGTSYGAHAADPTPAPSEKPQSEKTPAPVTKQENQQEKKNDSNRVAGDVKTENKESQSQNSEAKKMRRRPQMRTKR